MNRTLIGCIVPPAKISRYLLALDSVDGASKARFFMAFGFQPSRPDQLAEALIDHAVTQAVADTWKDAWGEHWNIVGPIAAPDGRRPVILSAWVKDGPERPRLVTAFPA